MNVFDSRVNFEKTQCVNATITLPLLFTDRYHHLTAESCHIIVYVELFPIIGTKKKQRQRCNNNGGYCYPLLSQSVKKVCLQTLEGALSEFDNNGFSTFKTKTRIFQLLNHSVRFVDYILQISRS